MVFHGKTISTKQIQTATPTAGKLSLSTLLSLKPGQLKYFFLNNRGEERKILEMQLSLVKHIMPNCVSMVTVDHRDSKEKKEINLGKIHKMLRGHTPGTVLISTLTTAAFQTVPAYVCVFIAEMCFCVRPSGTTIREVMPDLRSNTTATIRIKNNKQICREISRQHCKHPDPITLYKFQLPWAFVHV